MKYCLKCGRTLFDKDENCDKCNSNNFILEEDVNKIVEKINKSNKISLKFLLKNSTYKAVFDLIINKPIDYFSYDAVPIHKKYENTHHFKDLDERHTISLNQTTILFVALNVVQQLLLQVQEV